jgi:hypothetical protein
MVRFPLIAGADYTFWRRGDEDFAVKFSLIRIEALASGVR